MGQARLASTLLFASALALVVPHAQTPIPSSAAPAPSIVGTWTLNKDLSDKPPSGSDGREGAEGRRGQSGRHGGGGSGGGHRGGFGGGGFGRGGAGQNVEAGNPEDIQRVQNALRDELRPAEHLTITESGVTIIMTADDGRTTRLSADGKKIKDESTSVERKTKRDGSKLVSEISGLGRGKITETYTVDGDRKQLRVTLEMEGPKGKTTTSRVYDADPQ
jgi:hypothetical protein